MVVLFCSLDKADKGTDQGLTLITRKRLDTAKVSAFINVDARWQH